MPLILAIEPDQRQAAQIAVIARNRVGAELRLAATTEQALDVIGDRVPDLVLVPALLSPQDDAALAAALRVIAAAAHVRTLTIPVLSSGIKRPANEGVLAKWRRTRTSAPAPDGCDPAVFAEQISAYLREAAAERADLEQDQFIDDGDPASAHADAAAAAELTTAAPDAISERPLFGEPSTELPIIAPALTFGAQDDGPIETESFVVPESVAAMADEGPVETITWPSPESYGFDKIFTRHEAPIVAESPAHEPLAAFANPAPLADESVSPETRTFVEPQFFAEETIFDPRAAAPVTSEELSAPRTFAEDIVDVRAEAAETPALVTPALESQEATPPATASDPAWVEFDLSEELAEVSEPVFELELTDTNTLLLDDPAFAQFVAPTPELNVRASEQKPTVMAVPPAGHAAAPADDSETLAEIFAALSNVDRFVVRQERTPAQKSGVAIWTPLALTDSRWPRIEGVTIEIPELRDHKPAVVVERAARPAQKADAAKPEWSELIASLRQDIERLRGGNAAPQPAPVAARPRPAAAQRTMAPPPPQKSRSRGRPVQDEWGFFDPEQCGFAALLAKLNEITDAPEETELHAH